MQTPAASVSDPLALEPMPNPQIKPFLDEVGDIVGGIARGVISIAGTVAVNIEDGAQQLASSGQQWFDYVENAAAQGGQSVVNIFNSAVLRLTLHTTPAPPTGSVAPRGGPRPQDGGGTSNSPPMVWMPIQFPANATAMAFDFTVEGDPVDDVLVCGIGTNDLFSLQAKYVPTNGVSASRLMDVSAWAGTMNEVFFGLLGGTSTNCTVQVENIRFYSLQPPSLSVQVAGGSVVLTWPSNTGGYVLECSPTLTGASWQTITNAPVVSGSVYAMTNAISGGSMFYRLRQQ